MNNENIESNGQKSRHVNVASWERFVSAGAGGLLLTKSLGRSLPGTVLGAALAYRGLSGHCHLYESLNHSTAPEEHQSGEVRVLRVVTIEAPREELFQFFRHTPDRFAEIMSPLAEVTPLGDDRYRFLIKGPFKTYESITRVHNTREPESFEWDTESGEVEHRGSLRLQTSPWGTEVSVEVCYRVPGGHLTSALSRLTGREPHETLERALRQVKARFETGEVPTVEGQPMGAGKQRLVRDGATA
ncbi:MAG: YgaP-like transmembrane domain [Vulcanimicrobiota bacterium]